MFQAETEDMLPRMAPKPSPDVISASGETAIRPQVPEISILFGQQDAHFQQQLCMNNTHQQGKDLPQQTYAAWKKQMLPKVTFSATPCIANTRMAGDNMMGYNCSTTNMNSMPINLNPTMNIAPSTNMVGGREADDQVSNPSTLRRSLELYNNVTAFQPVQQTNPALPLQAPLRSSQQNFISRNEILTICAGTQTDNLDYSKPDPFLNLATKSDVENIWKMLGDLRKGQQSILKMLETFSLNQNIQTSRKIIYCDVGVQVDSIQTNEPVYQNGEIVIHEHHQQPLLKNKVVENLKPTNNMFQSPKGKPIAQSTTYRPNSPQYQNLKSNMHEIGPIPVFHEVNNVVTMIPKSASDTSLAMSELALKYLPNEKLSELLKELNMDYPKVKDVTNESNTPNGTNSGKFEKGPSDISNASYKYLKKYRLLPEDSNDHVKENAGEGALQNDVESHIPRLSSPQYNMQNTPPNHQRQTPLNKCSPYAAGCLPLSPLARASPSSIESAPPHIVNLDNIKQQPKFL